MPLNAYDLIVKVENIRERSGSMELLPDDEALLYAAALAVVCNRGDLDETKYFEFCEKLSEICSSFFGDLGVEMSKQRSKLRKSIISTTYNGTSLLNGHTD